MNRKTYHIDQQIKELWAKPCTNYSEAHFRAEKITRLEKRKEEILNGK